MDGTNLPSMRFATSALAAFAILAVLALPAGAQQRQSAPATAEPPRAERLDTLFSELRRSRNEQAAQRVANRIWREWFRSGSDSVDLLMQWADAAMKERRFDAALDFLDQVVVLAPDYAEGWNRRATVHFMMDDYGKSLADIERTLRLEPRHFGALGGLAQIMMALDRKERALEAYMRLLEVYPMMRSAQEQVGTIADELAGQRI